jgi:hypothetical protein
MPDAMKIALIGYGEVGRILAEDLRAGRTCRRRAFDLKLHGDAGEPLREHALRNGVTLADSHADAVRGVRSGDLGRHGQPGRAGGRGLRAGLKKGASSSTSIPPRRAPRSAPPNSSTPSAGVMSKAR